MKKQEEQRRVTFALPAEKYYELLNCANGNLSFLLRKIIEDFLNKQ